MKCTPRVLIVNTITPTIIIMTTAAMNFFEKASKYQCEKQRENTEELKKAQKHIKSV